VHRHPIPLNSSQLRHVGVLYLLQLYLAIRLSQKVIRLPSALVSPLRWHGPSFSSEPRFLVLREEEWSLPHSLGHFPIQFDHDPLLGVCGPRIPLYDFVEELLLLLILKFVFSGLLGDF